MNLKVGGILRCIKQVDYKAVYGYKKDDIIYHRLHKKYAIQLITRYDNDYENNDISEHYYNIRVYDESGGVIGFNIHDDMDLNLVEDTRYLHNYFIDVIEHRKKIIDGYKNR